MDTSASKILEKNDHSHKILEQIENANIVQKAILCHMALTICIDQEGMASKENRYKDVTIWSERVLVFKSQLRDRMKELKELDLSEKALWWRVVGYFEKEGVNFDSTLEDFIHRYSYAISNGKWKVAHKCARHLRQIPPMNESIKMAYDA